MTAKDAGGAQRSPPPLPGPATLAALGEFFKLIGDPSRLGILHALATAEMRVGELGAALGMSVSATSHQLALLRRARMVRARREGRAVRYALADRHVRDLIDAARVHLEEERRHAP